MSWRKIVCLNLLAVTTCVTSVAFAGNDLPGFAGGEHAVVGDNVKLYFSSNDAGSTHQLLQLPNGLKLSYGDVISMADFYGTPGRPVSGGISEAEREALFISAFISLAEDESYIGETKQLTDVIHGEEIAVAEGMKRGEKPEDVYRKINGENNRQFNCITGGGCDKASWWLEPGRFLDLANTDDDHFGENALVAYQTGHKLAIEQAIYAYQMQNEHQLEIAYAMNAFAGHFLSDFFASGHLRTPRIKLRKTITPDVVGSLLANYMHTEENKHGLHVHNLRGDHWMAYGDMMYFNPVNARNRELLQEAMQESANQIFAAYLNGYVSGVDKVSQLVPRVDYVGNSNGQDIAPLFYWDDQAKTLYRRTETSNVNDHHWTANWWGWSTLLQLVKERGMPAESQGALVRAGYGKEAVRLGLITDKHILSALDNHH